jgi:hypothetical protein
MISTKPVPSLFNRIESYKPVSIQRVVRYLHKTTGQDVLTAQNSYYDAYTVPLENVSNAGTGNVQVLLDYTVPNYGGLRYWLVCGHCRHRVINLYSTGARLACRHCLGLEYSSRIHAGNPLFLRFTRRQKAAELMGTRRLSYGGKPTRAGRRLNRLASYEDIASIISAAFSRGL